MDTTNLNLHAQLSTIANAAYLDAPPKTIVIGGVTWTYVTDSSQTTPTTSGFYAVAYYNPQTKQIAIGYRGTNDGSDISTDTKFKTGGWDGQFTDAAKFTSDVKALTIGKDAQYSGAKLLTTGHSLGDGIAQIMSVMFGLDGAGFEGPGAAAVVANPMFEIIKKLFANDVTTQTGSYTTYKVGGSLISSIGTHTGDVVNMVNLDEGSAIAFFSAIVGIVGIASGGVGNVLLGALGLTANNIASKHLLDGTERIMYVWAGLKNAIGAGDLNVGTVPMSSVTGQVWTGPGSEPNVVVFRKANGDVAAYVQKEGSGWKLSTIDQQTTITLTPAAPDSGEPPKCVVNQVGKDPYSCVLTQDANTVTRETDVGVNNTIDQTTKSTWYDGDVVQTDVYSGGSSTPSDETLSIGDTTYNLKDADDRNDASYEMGQLHNAGKISDTVWYDYTADDVAVVVSPGNTFVPTPSTPSTPSTPGDVDIDIDVDVNPSVIGAFYDSQSSAYDNAVSIANKTTRAMNASGQALSSAQLAALDANGDGQLSTSEASGVRLWADVNEDGRLDSGELQSVGSAIKSADYGFYTRGNGQAVSGVGNAPTAPGISVSTQRPQSPTGSAPGTPSAVALPTASSFVASGLPTAPVYTGVPASNYRTLRDTDNVYYVPNGWITFSASQVKINNSNRTYLVGTDGADSFDASYYASYTQYFNSSLLVNFLGGGGNDEMGGSTRNDNLWGGTGNDTVYGYAGDDKVYGEEGDDVFCRRWFQARRCVTERQIFH